MPLRMITPPALVHVRDLDGALRPALLLARRDDRSYLQVSRGAGDSVLRWLPSADVAAPSAGVAPQEAGRCDRAGPSDAPVRLRPPRSSR